MKGAFKEGRISKGRNKCFSDIGTTKTKYKGRTGKPVSDFGGLVPVGFSGNL